MGASDASALGRPSLAASALWLLSGKAAAFVLSVALPLVLVRRLSLEDFGVYKQVFLIAGSAVTLLPLGFATTAYYFLPRSPRQAPAVAFNIVLFHALVGGLACGVLSLAPGLLGVAFPRTSLAPLAPLVGAVVLLWIVAAVLEPIAVGNQEARAAAAFIAGMQLARTLLLLAAAIAWDGVRPLLYAAIAHGLVHCAVLAAYLGRRFGRLWRCFDWTLWRAQLGYALPHGLAALLWGLQSDLHQYLVASRYDAGVYALYAVGCFQLPLVAILNESVGSVLIPQASRLQLEGRPREILSLTVRMVTRLSLVILPLYAFLLLRGREFLEAAFTPRYAASLPIFAINLTLLPLSLVATACDPVIRAYADERFFLIRLRVVLSLLLVGALWVGATGPRGPVVAIAVVVAFQAVERLAIALRVGRVLGLRPRDLSLLRELAKVAFAAVGAGVLAALPWGGLGALHPGVALAVSGAAFALAYLGLLASLGLLRGAAAAAGLRLRLPRLAGAGRGGVPPPRDDAATAG